MLGWSRAGRGLEVGRSQAGSRLEAGWRRVGTIVNRVRVVTQTLMACQNQFIYTQYESREEKLVGLRALIGQITFFVFRNNL